MTETTEQRIERVARAIASHPNAKLGRGLERGWDAMHENDREEFRDDARAADAISFPAGWDAGAARLLKADMGTGSEWKTCAEWLAAHRPGEPT